MPNKDEVVSDKETPEDLKNLEQNNLDSHYNNHYYHHSLAKMAIIIFLGLVILGGVFALGQATTGFEKNHNNQVGFERSVGPRMMAGRSMMGRSFRSNNFAAATVTKIDGNNITIKKNDKEYSVVVNDQTSYTKAGEIAKQSDLKVGDNVHVSGSSNSQGQIVATAIRIQ